MEQDPNPDVSGATAVNSNSQNYQNRRYGRYEKTSSPRFNMGHDRYEKISSPRYNMGHSAVALVVTSKGSGYSDTCRYRQIRHWSD